MPPQVWAKTLRAQQIRGVEKVYVALFSCCVTRAVEDLSAEAFTSCLRRFIARNGTPELIVSNNTTTFQATEKALNQLFEHPDIWADLEQQRVEWNRISQGFLVKFTKEGQWIQRMLKLR